MHQHADGIRDASNKRLLAISLAITALVMVVQVVGAILTGSLALLADAAHMFTDASALVIALVASIVASRPADSRRTFGYQRAEVFGALINAVVLIVLALWVGSAAIGRMFNPEPVEVLGGPMLVVAIIGLAANAFSLWLLSSAQKRSINVRGAYLEVLGDLVGSVLVIAAAIVIMTTGWMPADIVASLAIALFILPRAFVLLREVFSVLAQSAPDGMSVDEIREHMLSLDGVVGVHDVHIWQLTRGAPVFTAHIAVDAQVLESGGTATVLEALQECLSEHFDVEHSTFQLEPAGRSECVEVHD